MALNLIELLQLRGLGTDVRVKMIRHADDRYDLSDLQRRGYFEHYQAFQDAKIFECDYVVAFLGLPNRTALLLRVYRVIGRDAADAVALPAAFPYPEFAKPGSYYYHLGPVKGFEDLEDRVVVSWPVPRPNHQKLKPLEVIEVRAKGQVLPFPGYLDFVLSYDELREMVTHGAANRHWHQMLEAVSGIYLILDRKTGSQYVGSACGGTGVLGRWKQYADTGHGGNVQLKALVDVDPTYARNFDFSLLQTLPVTLTRDEVLVHEARYKKKLGSRAHGLNSN